MTVETELLSAAFAEAWVTETVPHLAGRHFEQPMLGAMWDTLVQIRDEGLKPTVSLVTDRMSRNGTELDERVFAYFDQEPATVNADYYADEIIDADMNRRLHQTLRQGLQALSDGKPREEVVGELEQRLASQSETARRDEGPWYVDDVPDEPTEDDVQSWVVPGLLRRQDRLVLTGSEGWGKSQLMRQIALCTAAGMHPFTGRGIEPARTLLLDFENGRHAVEDEFRGLRTAISASGYGPTWNAMWDYRVDGLDLTLQRDRVWLRERCKAARPDLLVIGPEYKMRSGQASDDWEYTARTITQTLDKLRAEFGFALVLEHHPTHENGSGKRDMRPFGSGLWRRWPEFGVGLVPDDKDDQTMWRRVQLRHWRVVRRKVHWPKAMETGPLLPWTEC